MAEVNRTTTAAYRAQALVGVMLAIYFAVPAGIADAAGSGVRGPVVPLSPGCCCIIPIAMLGVAVAGGVTKRRRNSGD